MAERHRKLHMCNFLLSPLTLCKSKKYVNDVVDTHGHRRHLYRLIELSSQEPPQNSDGWKCPPATPVLSPLLPFCNIPRNPTKKKAKKLLGDDDERSVLIYWGSHPRAAYRRRRNATATAVQDSLAVVKRSIDPYGDFRLSMVEMIVENEIFECRDLEDLLHCFLSLNSFHHHKVIVEVFEEIWELLLPLPCCR